MSLENVIIVYNNTNISAWESTLRAIPNNQKIQNAKIQAAKKLISATEKELVPVVQNYHVLKNQVDACQAQVNSLYSTRLVSSLEHINANRQGKSGFLTEALYVGSDLYLASQIATAERNLANAQGLLSPVKAEKKAIENRLNAYRQDQSAAEQALERLAQRQAYCQNHIKLAKEFLQQLHTKPEVLYQALKGILSSRLDVYLQGAHQNEPQEFQHAIYVLEYGLNSIDANQQLNSLDKFYALCGLVKKQILFLDKNYLRKDSIYAALCDVYGYSHLSAEGKLPDDMEDLYELTCDEFYLDEIPELTEEDTRQFANEKYLKIKSELKVLFTSYENSLGPLQIKPLQQLAKLGKNLLSTLDQEETRLHKPDEKPFDKAYATSNLLLLKELLDRPTDIELQKRCLARGKSELTGKSSYLKLIGGIALTVASLALTVGFALAAVPTFGGSLFGVAVGTSILSEALMITGAVVSTVSLVASLGLFKSGMRKGISKAMVDFVHQEKTMAEMLKAQNQMPKQPIETVSQHVYEFPNTIKIAPSAPLYMPEPSAPVEEGYYKFALA